MFLLSHMCLALSQHHAARTRCLVQLKYSLLHDPHIRKSKLSNELVLKRIVDSVYRIVATLTIKYSNNWYRYQIFLSVITKFIT